MNVGIKSILLLACLILSMPTVAGTTAEEDLQYLYFRAGADFQFIETKRPSLRASAEAQYTEIPVFLFGTPTPIYHHEVNVFANGPHKGKFIQMALSNIEILTSESTDLTQYDLGSLDVIETGWYRGRTLKSDDQDARWTLRPNSNLTIRSGNDIGIAGFLSLWKEDGQTVAYFHPLGLRKVTSKARLKREIAAGEIDFPEGSVGGRPAAETAQSVLFIIEVMKHIPPLMR